MTPNRICLDFSLWQVSTFVRTYGHYLDQLKCHSNANIRHTPERRNILHNLSTYVLALCKESESRCCFFFRCMQLNTKSLAQFEQVTREASTNKKNPNAQLQNRDWASQQITWNRSGKVFDILPFSYIWKLHNSDTDDHGIIY